MKKIIKKILLLPGKILVTLIFCYRKILDIFGFDLFALEINSLIYHQIDEDIKSVKTPGKEDLKFYTPNTLCLYRAKTLYEKEPEIFEWFDDYGGEGAFLDIGANIGIYSCYYAKIIGKNVYSVEPSVFNLKQLVKNIDLNDISNKVTVLPFPLTNKTHLADFSLSNTEEGGAISAFGVDYDWQNKLINKEIFYKTSGYSLDDIFKMGLIEEIPAMIKIDVDGIEHLILQGGKNILKNENCRTIYVEVNDQFKDQSLGVQKILVESGFIFKEKRSNSTENQNKTYNQIWVK